MADEPLLHNNTNNTTTTASARHNAAPSSHSHHHRHQQQNQHQHGLLGQQHQQQLGLVNHHHHHHARQDASGSNPTATTVTVGLQQHSSLDRYASHIQQQPSPTAAAATSTQGGRSLTLSLPLHQHHRQGASLAAMPAARVPPLGSSGSGAAAAAGKQPLAARSVSPAAAAGIRAPGDGTASVDRPGHGRDDAWTEAATMSLVDAWGERYLQLNRGNLKQKHWREVADEVNRRAILDDSSGKACKTDVQCKNRLDTLKKKYKIEKCRLIAEGIPSKWAFFEKLDELVGPAKKGKKKASAAAAPSPNNVIKRIEESKVQATSNSSSSRDSAGMTDSCEHGTGNTAAAADGKSSGKKRKLDGPFKDLARAIVKFGEVYERIESAKQQQLMDLERQRMEFTKDLELQRMQLFMQTQVELAKMKHANKHGNTEHYL